MEIEILKTKLSKAGLNSDISYKEMQAQSSPTEDQSKDDVDKKMEADMQRASTVSQDITPPTQIKGITKTSSKEAALLKEQNETLKDNLLELQMEFDHYKKVKQEQILELQDKVEKLDEIEKELEKYQNMEDI